MRDPGSYEDIIDILADEKVIASDMQEGLARIIKFRKMTVQQYTQIDHESLNQEFKKELPLLQQYSSNIRNYLANELGAVSAFRK